GVALLRDPLDLVERAHGVDAEADEGNVELAADGRQLVHVRRQLLAGLVQRAVGIAGQLDLTAGLERDGCLGAPQGDRPPVLLLRLPPEAVGQIPEQGLDATPARERHRLTGARIDGELLVLRADRPALARLAGEKELLDELIDAFDRRRLAARAEVGHGGGTLSGRPCRRKARNEPATRCRSGRWDSLRCRASRCWPDPATNRRRSSWPAASYRRRARSDRTSGSAAWSTRSGRCAGRPRRGRGTGRRSRSPSRHPAARSRT